MSNITNGEVCCYDYKEQDPKSCYNWLLDGDCYFHITYAMEYLEKLIEERKTVYEALEEDPDYNKGDKGFNMREKHDNSKKAVEESTRLLKVYEAACFFIDVDNEAMMRHYDKASDHTTRKLEEHHIDISKVSQLHVCKVNDDISYGNFDTNFINKEF